MQSLLRSTVFTSQISCFVRPARRSGHRSLHNSSIVCEKVDSESKAPVTPATQSFRQTASRPPPPPPGFNPNIKIERVEKLDKEAWAGVAAVDKGEPATDWKKVAILVGGDVFMLLLFAAVGKLNHGEPITAAALLETAGPFIAGVLLTSPLSGAYGEAAQSGRVGPAALTGVKTWGLGIPVGLAIRSAIRGYIPDKTFIIVSMAVNFVFLTGWRSGFAALTPKDDKQSEFQKRKDKKGNPLEFFQLLTSLVKRW